jgi:formaldehyde-activating enzyme involved in methanogenesis
VNLDDVDDRFGEAWAGTAPNGSHVNLVIGRRGSPTAAAAAAAMADVRPGHQGSAGIWGPGIWGLTPGGDRPGGYRGV